MTYDPYQEAGLRRLPKTERHFDTEETQANIWLPLAIVVVLLLGIGYFFYGHAWNTSPNMRAESGAITKPEPSPN